MSVELVLDSVIVRVSELKDGQIGIIIEGEYSGEVVQGFEDIVVAIGKPKNCRWSSDNPTKVRVLKNGEQIKIVDNE